MDTNNSESFVAPISDFIRSVIELARNQTDGDARLLDILEKHIVTELPAAGAVYAAKKEIESLAEERAQTSTGK